MPLQGNTSGARRYSPGSCRYATQIRTGADQILHLLATLQEGSAQPQFDSCWQAPRAPPSAPPSPPDSESEGGGSEGGSEALSESDGPTVAELQEDAPTLLPAHHIHPTPTLLPHRTIAPLPPATSFSRSPLTPCALCNPQEKGLAVAVESSEGDSGVAVSEAESEVGGTE